MIEIIQHNSNTYLALQAEGFAMQYAMPFVNKLCKGFGLDVGCAKSEWSIPGALLVDPVLTPEYHAMQLPPGQYDYIASSHMLEHYNGRFQEVIEYWLTKIKHGGVIFLYLPHGNANTYWAWDNTKHIHHFTPEMFKGYCEHLNYKGLISRSFVTEGYDLNSSFYVVIEK